MLKEALFLVIASNEFDVCKLSGCLGHIWKKTVLHVKKIKWEKFQFSVILNTGQTGWFVWQKNTNTWNAEPLLGDWENLSRKILSISQIQRDLPCEIANPISNSSTNNWEMEIHNANA